MMRNRNGAVHVRETRKINQDYLKEEIAVDCKKSKLGRDVMQSSAREIIGDDKSPCTEHRILPNNQRCVSSEKVRQQFALKVKSRSRSHQSEEELLGSVNLLDISQRKRSRSNQDKPSGDSLPPSTDHLKNIDGSDWNYLYDTYHQVMYLYNNVLSNEQYLIKDYDKDTYLPSKLLANNKKYSLTNMAYATLLFVPFVNIPTLCISSDSRAENLMIDRAIVAIFAKASEKQNLNNIIMAKLFLCLKSQENVMDIMFGTTDIEGIAKQVVDKYIIRKYYQNEKKIISNVAERIYSSLTISLGWFSDSWKCDGIKLKRAIVDIIFDIQLDALTAIGNMAKNNPNYFDGSRINELKEFLFRIDASDVFENKKNTQRQKLSTIFEALKNTDQVDKSPFIDIYLSELRNGKNIETAISFFNDLSRYRNTRVKYFNTYFIKNLMEIIFSSKTLLDNQLISLIKIIRLSIQDSEKNTVLSTDFLNFHMKIFNKYRGFNYNIIKILLEILLLAFEQNKTLPIKNIESLFEYIYLNSNKVEKNDQSRLILFILYRIFQCQHEIKNQQLRDKLILHIYTLFEKNLFAMQWLASLLLDDYIPVERLKEEGTVEIGFDEFQEQRDGNGATSSAQAAYLLADICSHPVRFPGNLVGSILIGLSSRNKQGRIFVSKALYNLANNLKKEEISEKIINNSTLVELNNYILDPVIDVAVYIRMTYLTFLWKRSQFFTTPLAAVLYDAVPTLYVFDSLKLGEKDFIDTANQYVFDILEEECKKGQKLSDTGLELVRYFVVYEEKKYLSQCLKIIKHLLIAKHPLTSALINGLEQLVERDDYHDEIMGYFERLLENGELLSDRVMLLFADELYENDEVNVRDCAYRCLQLFQQLLQAKKLTNNFIEKLLLIEGAADSLKKSLVNNNIYEINSVLLLLQREANKGARLTRRIFDCFINLETTIESLSIILSCLSNGQFIPEELVKKIASINSLKQDSNPKKVEILLLVIANLLQNGQKMPIAFINELEYDFCNVSTKQAFVESRVIFFQLKILLLYFQSDTIPSEQLLINIIKQCRRCANDATQNLSKQDKQDIYRSTLKLIARLTMANTECLIKNVFTEIEKFFIDVIDVSKDATNHYLLNLLLLCLLRLQKRSPLTCLMLSKLISDMSIILTLSRNLVVIDILNYQRNNLSLIDKNKVDLLNLSVSMSDEEYLNSCFELSKNVSIFPQNIDRLHSILKSDCASYLSKSLVISIFSMLKVPNDLSEDCIETLSIIMISTLDFQKKEKIRNILLGITDIKKKAIVESLSLISSLLPANENEIKALIAPDSSIFVKKLIDINQFFLKKRVFILQTAIKEDLSSNVLPKKYKDQLVVFNEILQEGQVVHGSMALQIVLDFLVLLYEKKNQSFQEKQKRLYKTSGIITYNINVFFHFFDNNSPVDIEKKILYYVEKNFQIQSGYFFYFLSQYAFLIREKKVTFIDTIVSAVLDNFQNLSYVEKKNWKEKIVLFLYDVILSSQLIPQSKNITRIEETFDEYLNDKNYQVRRICLPGLIELSKTYGRHFSKKLNEHIILCTEFAKHFSINIDPSLKVNLPNNNRIVMQNINTLELLECLHGMDNKILEGIHEDFSFCIIFFLCEETLARYSITLENNRLTDRICNIFEDYHKKILLSQDFHQLFLLSRCVRLLSVFLPYDELCSVLEHSSLVEDISFESIINEIISWNNSLQFESDNLYLILRKKWLSSLLDNRMSTSIKPLAPDYTKHIINQLSSFNLINVSEAFLFSIDKEGIVDLVALHHCILMIKELTDSISILFFLKKEMGSIHVVRQTIECYVLMKCFNASDFKKLVEFYQKISKDISFEKIKTFCQIAMQSEGMKSEKQTNLMEVFHVINDYQLFPRYYEQVIAAICQPVKKWNQLINAIAIKKQFNKNVESKNIKELTNEFFILNEPFFNFNGHSEVLSKKCLKKIVAITQDNYCLYETESLSLLSFQYARAPVFSWGKEEIRKWIETVTTLKEDYFSQRSAQIDSLAVLRRANFLVTGFCLTHTQMLSFLIACSSPENKGCLLQISTGEGKTVIIAMLAIYQVLRGKQVDIATSSYLRAEEDVKSQKKFYDLLGVTVGKNRDTSIYVTGVKRCYEAKVVYGEFAQFQFDTLREEYSELGTFGNREKNRYLIIDEADTALLDDYAKLAKLSSNLSGMDQCMILHYYLWQRLTYLSKNLVQLNNNTYILNGDLQCEVFKKNGVIGMTYQLDGKEEIIKNLQVAIESNKIENGILEFVNDHSTFITDNITRYITDLINNPEESQLYFSKNICPFVKEQLPKWIESAATAFLFNEGEQYIIQDGVIKPVEYNTNGTIQESTNWSDGLHQFLQIKHGLEVTPETFTTNFISNISYINRYKHHVIGLTGTFGSVASQRMMEKIYDVSLYQIPSARKKQYLGLNTAILHNRDEWLERIINESCKEARKDRGVLIICQTINEAEEIYENLKIVWRISPVRLYAVDNDQSQIHAVEKMDIGDIIVATNLAGRGTDIKTTAALQQAGGIHVIVTFLPDNQRVEDQAFGRTSRQGKSGTGRKIIDASLIPLPVTKDQHNEQSLSQFREDNEKKELKAVEENIRYIKVKDALFNKFCFLLKEMKNKLKSQEIESDRSFYELIGLLNDAWYQSDIEKAIERAIILSMEERWALFLIKNESRIQKDLSIQEEFSLFGTFEKEIRDDVENKLLIRSAPHCVQLGNALLFLLEKAGVTAATHYFKQALDDDANHAAAYFGLGWAKLQLVNPDKEEVYNDFKRALLLTEKEMEALKAITVLQNEKNQFKKQLITHCNMLGHYITNIQNAIDTIHRSKRCITLTINEGEKSDIYEEVERNFLDTNKIYTFINKCNISSQKSLGIAFHDLTGSTDLYVFHHQAIDILSDVMKEINENRNYNNTITNFINNVSPGFSHIPSLIPCIETEKFLLEQYQSFITKNPGLSDMTPSVAIEELKKKQGYIEKASSLITSNSYFSTTVLLIIFNEIGDEKFNKNCTISEAIIILENKQKSFSTDRVQCVFLENGNPLSDNLITDVTLYQINDDEFKKRAKNIKAKSIDINIDYMGQKKKLIEQIKKIKLRSQCVMEFTRYEIISKKAVSKETYQSIDIIIDNLEKIDTTESHLNTIEYFSILFKNIKETSIEIEKNILFNASFNGIHLSNSTEGLENGLAKCRFNVYGKEEREILIKRLHDEKIKFSLIFSNINKPQTIISILKTCANIKSEDIKVRSIQSMDELFIANNIPTKLLESFNNRGIEYLINISENVPMPWKSMAFISSLAVAQIAIGCFLASTAYGAGIGMNVITEGISDLSTVYNIHQNRHFSLKEYGFRKSISVAISMATIGLPDFKKACRGANVWLKGLGREAVEQASTQAVVKGVGLLQTSLKFTGTKILERVATEAITAGFHHIVSSKEAIFRKKAIAEVRQKVVSKFTDTRLSRLIRKFYAFKLEKRVHTLFNSIKQEQYGLYDQCYQSAGQHFNEFIMISSGITQKLNISMADGSKLNSSLGLMLRTGQIINAIAELTTIIDGITNKLVEKIALHNIDLSRDYLSDKLKLTPDNAASIEKIFIRERIFDEDGCVNIENIEMIYKLNEKELKEIEKDVLIAWCKTIADESKKVDCNQLIGEITMAIVDRCMQVAQSNIVSPITSYAAGKIVNKASNFLQHQIIAKTLHNRLEEIEDEICKRDSHILESEIDDESYLLENEKKDIENLIKENKLSYSRLIQHQADRVIQNKEEKIRSRAVSHVREKNINASSNYLKEEKLKEIEERIKSGNLSKSEMEVLIKKKGLKVNIVNNINYQLTEQEKKDGVKVVLYKKGTIDENGITSIGHWELIENGKSVKLRNTGNDGDSDCGYAVISYLSGEKISTIKEKLITCIGENSDIFSEVEDSNEFTRDVYKNQSDELLMLGADFKKCGDKYLCSNIKKSKELSTEEKRLREDVVAKTHNVSEAAYLSKEELNNSENWPPGLELVDVIESTHAIINTSNEYTYGDQMPGKVVSCGTKAVIFRDKNNNRVYIGFEGTNGPIGWYDTLFSGMQNSASYFDRHMDSIINMVNEKCSINGEKPQIIFTGHSKGGYIANCVTQTQNSKYQQNDKNNLGQQDKKIYAVVYDSPLSAGDNVVNIQAQPNAVNSPIWSFFNLYKSKKNSICLKPDMSTFNLQTEAYKDKCSLSMYKKKYDECSQEEKKNIDSEVYDAQYEMLQKNNIFLFRNPYNKDVVESHPLSSIKKCLIQRKTVFLDDQKIEEEAREIFGRICEHHAEKAAQTAVLKH